MTRLSLPLIPQSSAYDAAYHDSSVDLEVDEPVIRQTHPALTGMYSEVEFVDLILKLFVNQPRYASPTPPLLMKTTHRVGTHL